MFRARAVWLSFALLIAWNFADAQLRVALLPFNNAAARESARELVESYSQKYLARRGIVTVDADSVNHVLRSLRIRNTALPTNADLGALADSLDVTLVILGTIHRFSLDSAFSEATVCARLIDVSTMQMVWSECATAAGGGEHAIVSSPVHRHANKLAKSVTKRLFSSLSAKLREPRYRVEELVVKNRSVRQRIPCSTVAVIPPLDEAENSVSGNMIGDLLVNALARRGFRVVDPGQVRDIMLQCEDLRHGQSVNTVSTALADSLGVELVITGSVSELTSTRIVSLGTSPEAAIELRMITPSNNVVVWAKNFRSSGKSGSSLFGIGTIHSPSRLVTRMVDSAVSDLRVVRRRNTLTSQ
jgi:TolB-like protein